ncbi:LysR family transcriptional regulator [Brevibacterium aurantiacum]|uniref:DNA-binding transcriptional regulator, LysR family n=1 Tax=Brevibacterium aurantiacum TaxID=273384 RepID=A0A2H1HXH4_BREAU|nr:LysR family transcriptional regulator [Brevibacterium aurantiacum]AZL04761.1 LysR family transcriptional regulator [Brevibacterium aurantiacum]AZT96177.1 LysR family transcriptional regulator [Brevibacterium aurantiacum]MDN6372972.1 LysR family transcriptional regulator [Brevibacterium aurantiacum]PCC55879.1 LysR family transcriptional regulator [Brevibacterium aurantiacum]SMX67627.1 DNA-binding transcriptional regulator, LysR family [Brevibacterium aurantiacum]
MDPRHLELLRQLDERGSVTAVAEATFRTPSAVSQQLKQATREVGHRLVEPAGRSLKLTPAGRVLAAGGQDVASALARVEADWEDYLGEASGEVRIAGLPSALTYLVPPALRQLRETSPKITLRTVDVDLAEHEFAGLTSDVDIVVAHSLISERPAGTNGLSVESLATEPIDVAVADSHPLAGRDELTPADLVDVQWISVPHGFPFATILTSIEHVTGRELEVTQRIRDNRLIEAIVSSSDQVALLPRFTTPKGAGLTLLPLKGVATTRWVVAVMAPDTAERAAVKRVLDALRQDT